MNNYRTPSRPVMEQLQDDVHAFVRSGAMFSAETEQVALAAFRKIHRLTERQAEGLWIRFTTPANVTAPRP